MILLEATGMVGPGVSARMSSLFANGPTEKSGIAFLTAERAHENHDQLQKGEKAIRGSFAI